MILAHQEKRTKDRQGVVTENITVSRSQGQTETDGDSNKTDSTMLQDETIHCRNMDEYKRDRSKEIGNESIWHI